ncbi:hypothetical protein QBC47DRAFT_119929 [Echria macrotheca]|uniref:Clock-controlled protein 6 n=1 Tax=Echria macrotheca TaxID=438768 RepID=A0AAJ0B2Y6_9PEZI|nr:hypothetical protein QBC47DRAFT_119929 [Echria macrotheca]
MKFSVAAVFAAVAGAHAWGNVTYTTEVVTAVTTFCPEATEIVHGDKTYTVSEATTLTITNCPCTVTKPVTVVSSVICHTCAPSAPPAKPTWPAKNETVAVPTGGATPTASKPPQVTAGAGKTAALSGAALAGVLGLAAFIL